MRTTVKLNFYEDYMYDEEEGVPNVQWFFELEQGAPESENNDAFLKAVTPVTHQPNFTSFYNFKKGLVINIKSNNTYTGGRFKVEDIHVEVKDYFESLSDTEVFIKLKRIEEGSR